jgi:hypothetical protein
MGLSGPKKQPKFFFWIMRDDGQVMGFGSGNSKGEAESKAGKDFDFIHSVSTGNISVSREHKLMAYMMLETTPLFERGSKGSLHWIRKTTQHPCPLEVHERFPGD